MTESIGVVGLGLVGAALAELLITRGYRVVGCDIDPAKNAVLATRGGAAVDTPAEVAARCDRIILSLMTTNIVRHVVEGEKGILSASRPPACIIDTTTGDPVETAALAERLATRGVAYLDATISGSSEQIRRRVGTFMVGGAPETFALHRDLLDVFSDFVFHLGAAGSGSRAKLASNLVLGLNRLVGIRRSEGRNLILGFFGGKYGLFRPDGIFGTHRQAPSLQVTFVRGVGAQCRALGCRAPRSVAERRGRGPSGGYEGKARCERRVTWPGRGPTGSGPSAMRIRHWAGIREAEARCRVLRPAPRGRPPRRS
jgi:hypothetical protein